MYRQTKTTANSTQTNPIKFEGVCKKISSVVSLSLFISTQSALANSSQGAFSTPLILPTVHHAGLNGPQSTHFALHALNMVQHTASISHAMTAVGHSNPLNNFSASHLRPLTAAVHVIPFVQSIQNLGLSLDLSSSQANVTLGNTLFSHQSWVTINVGGVNQTFHAGSQVTAAEYVAIKQVLSGSTQALTVNSNGIASGGTFSLNAVASPKIGELVVPVNVTAIDNVSANKSLSISGDLLNYGSIYGVSASGSSGVLAAKDIVNEVGGIISTQLPTAISSAYHGNLTNVSLTLSALVDITNAGMISSSGALTLSAGGNISNGSQGVSIVGASVPTLQAHNTINLLTGAGTVTNSGLVSSANGCINLALVPGATSTTFNINAPGGTFRAPNGNINIGLGQNGSTASAVDINMAGGNYLSKNLNLDAGTGAITGVVGTVSGNLNSTGNAAHFLADTATLHIGTNTINGDPTYANAGGNIVLDGAVTAAENITILAAGDITASGNAYVSTAQSAGVSATPTSDITLIAGAGITLGGTGTGGANSSTTNISALSSLNGTQTASVNLAGTTGKIGAGGDINLTGSTHAGPILDTSSTLAAGGFNQVNGGNIVLAAEANGTTGGHIFLPSSGVVINTSSANGNGGNVTILAGANPSTAGTDTVKLGDIVTSASGTSGAVAVYTSRPSTTDGQPIVYDISGNVTSGNAVTFNFAAATPTVPILQGNAAVQLGNVTTAGATGLGGAGGASGVDGLSGTKGGNAGNITISAGSNITTGSLNAFGGGGGGGGAGGTGVPAGDGGDGGNGAAIAVTSTTGALAVTGDVNISGGGAGGGGGGGGGNASSGGVGGTLGNAGGGITISVGPAAAVNISGGTYAVDGSNGGAGGAGTLTSAGSGGGGGASYGGGGGGGGGAQQLGGGGGGGGGTYGGGAGGTSGAQAAGNSADGGSGGGGTTGSSASGAIGGYGGAAGSGGTAGGNGSSGQGGSGPAPTGGTIALGGTLGNPGSAGATAGGSAATSGATLVVAASNASDIQITAGSISTGAVAGANITLLAKSATTGSITINGNLTGGDTVQLEAAGPGNITQSAGSVMTAGTNLQVQTENGDIGAAGQFLAVNSPALTLNSSNGSIYVRNSASSTTVASGTGNVYDLTMTNATGGSIVLAAGAQIKGTTSATLVASGTGSITQSDALGLITTPTLTLTTAGGDIGTTVQSVATKAATLSFNATSSGNVYLSDSSAALTLAGTNAGNNVVLADNVAPGAVITMANANSLTAASVLTLSNSLGGLSFSGTGAYKASVALNLAAAGNLDLGGILPNYTAGTGANFSAIASGNVLASGATGTTLTIDGSSSAAAAGTLEITAGSNFLVLPGGSLTTNGVSKTGGNIAFNQGPTVAFKANSATGTGGTVVLKANAGSTKNSGAIIDQNMIDVSGAMNGTVVVSAGGANATGQSIVLGNITAAKSASDTIGSITLTGPQSGKIGSVAVGALQAGHDITISTAGNINYVSASTENLTLVSTAGILTLPTSSITANTDVSSNGGSIALLAPTIVWANSTTTPLTLNANAAAGSSGNGGSVSVAVTGTKGIAVGTAKGNFIISASGGTAGLAGGNGGSINVTSGGNLTVNTASLTYAPLGTTGNGGNISLIAGQNASGNLLIAGNLNVTPTSGNGGNISLTSNSSSAFTISATAKTNGYQGQLSAAGGGAGSRGNITVTNNGGGITQTTAAGSFNNMTYKTGKAGAITLTGNFGDASSALVSLQTASGAIVDKTGTLQATTVLLNSTSGAIGPLSVNTANLAANSTGVVAVTDSTANPLNLVSASGRTVTISSAGEIDANGSVTATSAVTLKSTGNNGSIILAGQVNAGKTGTVSLTANGTGSISDKTTGGVNEIVGGTLNLTASGGVIGNTVSDLRTNVTTLNASNTTGDIQISNSNIGILTLKTLNTSGNITVVSAGSITDSAKILNASKVALSSIGGGGAIAVNGITGGATTTSVTLSASGKGNISGSQLITGNSVVLSAGTGSIGALKVNAASLQANTAGKTVAITDVSTTPVALGNSSSGGAFSLTTSASTTLNNITASLGLLKVVETKGTLSVASGAKISTANGGITLNNSDAKAGAIVINDGATISSLAKTKGQGTVIISVGSASPAKVVGTAPSNATVSGTVFFGKNSITSNGTTANSFTGKNTNLIFSTGTLPASAITVGTTTGNVTIIADPPGATTAAPTMAQSGGGVVAPVAQSSASSSNVHVVSSLNNIDFQYPGNLNTSNLNVGNINLAGQNAISTSMVEQTQNIQPGLNAASGKKISGGITENVVSKIEDDSYVAPSNGTLNGALISDVEFGLGGMNARTADFERTTEGGVNTITLRAGNLLLAPKTRTVVKTANGQVEIKANAVVFVIALPQGLAVYNLHDTERAAVVLSNGERHLAIAPGRHALIAPQAIGRFEEANPAQALAFGEVLSEELSGKVRLFSGDFSITSAIGVLIPLNQLLHCKEQSACQLSAKLLKTAAILSQLHGQNAYEQKTRRVMTAYQN